MTSEELYRGIENIDEDLINDVNFSPKKRNNRKLVFAVAACLCLIIGITAIMNINTSTEVKASREVIEQGEYYQIVEIKRVFQNGFHKAESIQYNYVVYNGKFVLAFGVSMKKPEVHNLSETVICIEHSDYTREYLTYCNLIGENEEEIEDLTCTIYKDNLFYEFDGKAVYLDYWGGEEEPVICVNRMDGENWQALSLGYKPTNINVTLNDTKNKITVKYNDDKGNKKIKKIKIKNTKKVKQEILTNNSEVICSWKDKLVEKTEYNYTYKIDFTVNRERAYVSYEEEDDLYQCFIVVDNKIIDEGCYKEEPPRFILVEDDILAMKYEDDTFYDYSECRFYKLSTGDISQEYYYPLFTVKGKVAVPSLGGEKSKHILLYDIFTREKTDINKYKLLDVKITEDGITNIKYKTSNNEVKSETLKLIYTPDKNGFKESGIENIVKTYSIENEYVKLYFYFVFNKEGTEIVYYDYNISWEPEITKISDDIIKMKTYYEYVDCVRYYDISTNTLTEQYVNVRADSNEYVAYITYDNNDTYINISNLFGTSTKKYIIDREYTEYVNYYYDDVYFKDSKLIIKAMPRLGTKETILEYPIE